MKSVFLLLITLLFFPQKIYASVHFTAPPTKIIIPSANISLPVNPAKITFNTWDVRTDGASFGQGSTYPGNVGNTVIFSHRLPYLFANLNVIHKEDRITLLTNSRWFIYKVTEIQTVNPDDIDILKSTNKKELTLYTCDGPVDQKRFVVRSKLIHTSPRLTQDL